MNRRLALKMLAASTLSKLAVSDTTTAEDPILELDCSNLLARIRDGSLRAEQVCERFLQQYERQRSLNVVTWIDAPNVLSRARNVDRSRDRGAQLPALAGLPILIKDNIDTVGMPTSAGTPSLMKNFPRRNARVVEKLLQQGAIVMGKANMHELSLGFTSSNSTFGFVRNPYNPDLIPGGSSGGSAAAVAARIVPAALGTDTGASVRIPAAFCGVVGFRPSIYPRKLYSQEGIVPLSLDMDTIGPMGRSVADVSLLHATIMDQSFVAHSRSLENARIGVPRLSYWADLDPEVERVAQTALTRLRDRGAVLVEVDLCEVKEAALQICYKLLSGIRIDLRNFLRTQVPSVSLHDMTGQIASPDVRELMDILGRIDPVSDLPYARGVGRDAARASYREVFRHHGIQAIVFPTAVVPPPPIQVAGDNDYGMIKFGGRMVPISKVLERNTLPTSALGAPALSLPAGLTGNRLPVALEFDGLPGNDSALLALGIAVEAAIGPIPAPPHAV